MKCRILLFQILSVCPSLLIPLVLRPLPPWAAGVGSLVPIPDPPTPPHLIHHQINLTHANSCKSLRCSSAGSAFTTICSSPCSSNHPDIHPSIFRMTMRETPPLNHGSYVGYVTREMGGAWDEGDEGGQECKSMFMCERITLTPRGFV